MTALPTIASALEAKVVDLEARLAEARTLLDRIRELTDPTLADRLDEMFGCDSRPAMCHDCHAGKHEHDGQCGFCGCQPLPLRIPFASFVEYPLPTLPAQRPIALAVAA